MYKLLVSFAKNKTECIALLQQALPIMEPGPVLPVGAKPIVSQEPGFTNTLGLMVSTAYQKGYFTQTNDQLITNISYNAGMLVVNNKPVLVSEDRGQKTED